MADRVPVKAGAKRGAGKKVVAKTILVEKIRGGHFCLKTYW
jgi:hypothetical protein